MEPVHARRARAAAALPALRAGPVHGEQVAGAAAVRVALALRTGGETVEDGGVAVAARVRPADRTVVAEVEVGTYTANDEWSALLASQRSGYVPWHSTPLLKT